MIETNNAVSSPSKKGEGEGSASERPLFTISRKRLGVVFWALLFRVSIDLLYVYCVSPIFGYAGFETNINWTYLQISYGAVVVVALLTPQRRNRPSNDIAFIFYVLAYIPASSVFALLPGSLDYFALYTVSILILYATVALLPEFQAPKDAKDGLRLFIGIALACTALVFALMIARGGLAYFSFDIFSVYSRRGEIGTAITSGYVGYLTAWAAKVYVPAIVVYGLWKKQKAIAILGVVLSLLFFAFTSAKAYIFNPVGVVVVYWACKTGYLRLGFLAMAIGGALVGLLFFVVFDNRLFASFLSMRMFALPSLLEIKFYQFFQTHPFDYWSNTFMSVFYPNPYSEPVSMIIGRGMWGNGVSSDSMANTGIFATGYQHFGSFGMFILAMLTGVVFKVVDMLVVGRMPHYVGLSITLIPAVQFLAADFTEVLLTHGIMMVCLTLYLIGDHAQHSTKHISGDADSEASQNA